MSRGASSPVVAGPRRSVVAERLVPAMGGQAHLIAVAGSGGLAAGALDAACEQLGRLEERWSRVRPDSEICVLGRGRGRPIPVSAETRLLVLWCITAWQRSGGLFDPTVLEALEGQGYDRTFDDVLCSPVPVVPPRAAAGGCAGIVVDDAAGTVTVPAGLRLDPGGIGKGLAADLVTATMLGAGADGCCVNLSGDIRARGRGPESGPGGWTIGIEHPCRPGEALATVTLPAAGGAVASSSVLVRRWAGTRHHIIDPACGSPADSDVVAATVVEDGAWADAATKIALVNAGHREAIRQLDALDVAAVLTLRSGGVTTTRAFSLRSDG